MNVYLFTLIYREPGEPERTLTGTVRANTDYDADYKVRAWTQKHGWWPVDLTIHEFIE